MAETAGGEVCSCLLPAVSPSVYERERRFSGVIQQLSAVQAVVPVTVLHCWENKRCSIGGGSALFWCRCQIPSGSVLHP